MYAEIAVVVIVALVGVASASSPECKLQSEVPTSGHPEFHGYIQVNGSGMYLPLSYKGRSSEYDSPIDGVSRGKAEITTDCADIHTFLAVDEASKHKIYDMRTMTFSVGESKQSCILGPLVVKKDGVKHYDCRNADEQIIATLIVERLSFADSDIGRVESGPTKLCEFTWVEQGQH